MVCKFCSPSSQWSASSAAPPLQDLQPLPPQWSARSAALNHHLREPSKRTVSSMDEASSSSPDFALAIEQPDSSATTKERTRSKERLNGSRDGIGAIPETPSLNGSPRPTPRARQEKPVDSDFIQALQEKSPGINVKEEIQKMERWLVANPRRKLTRKFAIAWINRIKPETPTNGQSAYHPERRSETPEEKEARWAREEAYSREPGREPAWAATL